MSLLKSDVFLALQDVVTGIPIFPFLWIPHAITMPLLLRAQLGDGWRDFSRRHPLSCYAVNLLYTFSGAIVGALVLGEPLLEFFSNTPLVLSMTAAWYLVFYAPSDALVRAVSALRLRVPLVAMQDFMRVRLVLAGVQTIAATHPSAPLYALAFGFVKSCAFVLLKYVVDVAVGGGINGRALEINHHSSKSCVLAAAAFTAQIYGFLEGVSLDALFTLTVVIMVSKRLSAMAVSDFDPYCAGEGAVCSLLFGNSDEAKGDSKEKTAPAPSKVCYDSSNERFDNKVAKTYPATVCLMKMWRYNHISFMVFDGLLH